MPRNALHSSVDAQVAQLVTGEDRCSMPMNTDLKQWCTNPEVYDCEWAIVGGGPQGIHLAATLTGCLGVGKERICIIDPHPELLTMWHTRTSATGMLWLRSPWQHHLGLNPDCLNAFRAQLGLPLSVKPPLALFNDHCHWLCDQFGLFGCHLSGYVQRIEVEGPDQVHLFTDSATVRARRVLLAIGPSSDYWPAWCRSLKIRFPDRVSHAFGHYRAGRGEQVAVVGNGLTAAQTALHYYRRGNDVTIFAKRKFSTSEFDVDPSWMLGSEPLTHFRRKKYEERCCILGNNNLTGSVPEDYTTVMNELIDNGSIKIIFLESPPVSTIGKCIDIAGIPVDKVVVCTGTEQTRPGGQLVDTLVSRYQLPLLHELPVPSDNLQWGSTPIFVSGILAQLQLGPTAGGFRGAQSAGERLRETLC